MSTRIGYPREVEGQKCGLMPDRGAFGADEELLETAKLAILGASLAAGALGSIVLLLAQARAEGQRGTPHRESTHE